MVAAQMLLQTTYSVTSTYNQLKIQSRYTTSITRNMSLTIIHFATLVTVLNATLVKITVAESAVVKNATVKNATVKNATVRNATAMNVEARIAIVRVAAAKNMSDLMTKVRTQDPTQ